MGFENPTTTLPASAVTDGIVGGLWVIGTPGAARIEIGTQTVAPFKSGFRVYDGTGTLVAEFTATGSGALNVLNIHQLIADVGTIVGLRSSWDFQAAAEGTALTGYGDVNTFGPQATVTVPPSGSLEVDFTAQIQNSTATGFGIMSIQVDDFTAGTQPKAATDNCSVVGSGTSPLTLSRTTRLSNLTPGNVVGVTGKYRSSAITNTATFSRREIVVRPLP